VPNVVPYSSKEVVGMKSILRPARLILAAAVVPVAALVAVLLPALPAGAVQPEINRFACCDTFVSQPGEICDFPLQSASDFAIIDVTYFNQQGEPVRHVDHVTGTDTETNLATGATITGDDAFIVTLDVQSDTVAYRGLNAHYRTADGKTVILAGRMTFNASTGELLSVTPHMGGGYPLICKLLGGNPA
jgi:hypothetical protein